MNFNNISTPADYVAAGISGSNGTRGFFDAEDYQANNTACSNNSPGCACRCAVDQERFSRLITIFLPAAALVASELRWAGDATRPDSGHTLPVVPSLSSQGRLPAAAAAAQALLEHSGAVMQLLRHDPASTKRARTARKICADCPAPAPGGGSKKLAVRWALQQQPPETGICLADCRHLCCKPCEAIVRLLTVH